MITRALILLVVLFAGAVSVAAQTLVGDRIRLSTGPCTIRSGPGSPEGVVTGIPCDEWHRTDTSQIYKKISGTGNTGWYPVLGATSATCATFAGCVAARLEMDFTTFTQKLRTDPSFKFQQYVNTDGAHIQAFNGGGWMPLRLEAGPTRILGGGLHIGSAAVSDPGLGNVAVDGFIGKPGYVSQATGWRIDGLGAADFRYLYADELHARQFIADLEQALAGLQIIAKSVAQTGASFTVPAAGASATLTLKDLPSAANMAVFESGDYVWLRTFSRASGSLTIANAYGTVSGYTDLSEGLQSWTFTRLATNGGNVSAGTVVPVDAIVLDVGVPGSGWIETNAVDGVYGINAPYTQTVTWSGNSPIAANQVLRTRLGNLRGVTGNTGEYGLLAGTYAATNGAYLRASNQAFELHGVDLSLWNGATRVLRASPTVPYWSMGNPAPTAYGTGTGCWSGLDSGTFKWRCGDIAGGAQYIAWDGSTLSVKGAITVLGLDASGNPTLPAAATPSGSGLFLGSDKLGYYSSGAWRTYMDNTGNFYLGGTGGALQWNGTTLTIAATMSGNGAGITSISGGNITTGTITATQIAANTITAAKIAAGTITATELAADSVTSAKITAGTIVSSDIAAGTITAANIAAGTITASEIAANTITSAKILAGTITANEIAAGTITAANIVVGTITADRIIDNGITGAKIANNTITAGKLSVSSIDAISATLGSVTVGSGGNVRQGQSAYNTGTGWWIGDVSGTPKFSIGNPSGAYMTWDGSRLTVNNVTTASTSFTDTGNICLGTAKTGNVHWSGGGTGTWQCNGNSPACTIGDQLTVTNTTTGSGFSLTVLHNGGDGLTNTGDFDNPGAASMVLARGDWFTAECKMSGGGIAHWFVLSKTIA